MNQDRDEAIGILINAGLQVYTHEGVAKRQVFEHVIRLVILIILYMLTTQERYEEKTDEHARYISVVNMI